MKSPRPAGNSTSCWAGWSPEAIRGDLAELLSGQAPRPEYRRPAFFRSIGLGLEDVALANALYRLRQAG